MPDLMSLAGSANPYIAGANAASGLISGITGLIQKGKANKMLKKLQYPTESMPNEIIQNQRLAQTRAAEGLPSEQYNQAMKNIQRQQLMALRGAHDRRGGLGSLSAIQQGTNDSTLNLDVANAQQRLANEGQLMNVNNQVAGWKSRLFNSNVRDKYNRDYNYAMGLLGMGNQNLVGGIDKISAGGLGLLSGGGGFGGGQGSEAQMFGGSGLSPEAYGASVYDKLINRPRIQ